MTKNDIITVIVLILSVIVIGLLAITGQRQSEAIKQSIKHYEGTKLQSTQSELDTSELKIFKCPGQLR